MKEFDDIVEASTEETFSQGKNNYRLMIIGLVIVAIGFALMAGGRSDDPNVFNPEIFNTQRITIAPLTVLFGYMFIIYAILVKPKG
jgi:hypothetical protein